MNSATALEPGPRQTFDYTKKEGAQRLKETIEAYWRERGFDVQVMLAQGPFTIELRAARYDVRSDLINGMPRAALEKMAEALKPKD
ncbi:MAG: hypothetical protein R3C16_11080 [Hyphomonadaceae bacterium]